MLARRFRNFFAICMAPAQLVTLCSIVKADEINGIKIEHANVLLKGKVNNSAHIVNIAEGRHSVADVGIASIQLINPGPGQNISMTGNSGGYSLNGTVSGSLANIAASNQALVLNVGSVILANTR